MRYLVRPRDGTPASVAPQHRIHPIHHIVDPGIRCDGEGDLVEGTLHVVCRCERVAAHPQDRKSTRLNSSHVAISYAVFCLKKKRRLTLEQWDTPGGSTQPDLSSTE